MYDRSVWIEEVDKGLYDLIKKVVHYPDLNNTPISVTPTFPLANTDLEDIQLPTVIIKHIGEKFDMDRYDPNNTLITVSTSATKVTREELAKPYTLNYQLDFLSEYKEDMNSMLKYWHSFVGKRYMLPVVNAEGKEMTCYMVLVKDPTTLNQQKGDIKLYRTVMLYDIKVELDMGATTETNIVTGLNLDIDS